MRDAFGRVERVLVLGGGSAIGVAIAEALVRQRGAREVVLAARRPDDLGEQTARLTAAGAAVHTTAFDLLEVEAHEKFVAEVVEAHGDLDVVVLAGGVHGDQARAEDDPAHALHILDTNFRGAASIALHTAKRLRSQGHGALVVLSSIAGVQPRRVNFVYGSAKAGLDALCRGLDDTLRPAGARCLVVRPGFVRSPMTAGMAEAPLAQDVEDVAEATLAGLDGTATVVHTSPAITTVSRIFQVLPRPLVRLLPR